MEGEASQDALYYEAFDLLTCFIHEDITLHKLRSPALFLQVLL